MFEAKRVTINEATSTLLAKGPCRCRIAHAPAVAGAFFLGEQSVTALNGYQYNAPIEPELALGTGERVFAISGPGAGTFDLQVITYGTP